MPLAIGQRVVCEAELGLGLGTIKSLEQDRFVDIEFAAVEQVRRYRIKTAPLRRVILRQGQKAVSRSGQKITVESVRSQGDLLVYCGQGQEIPENELSDKVPLSGNIDRFHLRNLNLNDELELHIAAWNVRGIELGSKVRGLCGSRVELLGHQLYLAQRVAQLGFPRVLLADQVGLGKTIEAGLIFSALRTLGRADKVLVVVPDSLLHQWLAEMVRRFHELFSVVDKNGAMEALNSSANPYAGSARIITTWGALQTASPLGKSHTGAALACAIDWDLVIIDESHHLQEGQFSYKVASHLAARTAGLLLLTGTPTRKGEQTEFNLLRLVDPQRFSDFESFQVQRRELNKISALAQELCLAGEEYAPGKHDIFLHRLLNLLPKDEALAEAVRQFKAGEAQGYRSLIEALIDRHGPGRVVFRNRRERLQKLFPGRHLELVPLQVERSEANAGKIIDPRLSWIFKFLRENSGEKVVVIASKAEVAKAIQAQLCALWDINCAIFFEEQTLIERDKQAAWFSADDGPQIMVCSEIGSEGRNFQFASNLVFWDVPVQPDIVEQRIGRLDRIGQRHIVNVFVLYIKGTPVEYLLKWHMALGSFNGPLEGGSEIVAQVDLLNSLNAERFPAMLQQSQELAQQYLERARENVDFLVDLNSYNEEKGAQLCREIAQLEERRMLPVLINRLMEVFGVDIEETHVEGIYFVQAGNNTMVESLSGIRPDGMLVTYDRQIAVQREDVEFLTIDHPLVQSLLSALLDSDYGNAVALVWKGAPKRGLLLQCLFVLEAMGPVSLELYRYLPPQTVLVNMDINGNLYDGDVRDVKSMSRASGELLERMLGLYGTRLEHLVEKTAAVAAVKSKECREQVLSAAEQSFAVEYGRLQELQKVNPLVSDAELQALAAKRDAVMQALREAEPRLDGLRIVLMQE